VRQRLCRTPSSSTAHLHTTNAEAKLGYDIKLSPPGDCGTKAEDVSCDPWGGTGCPGVGMAGASCVGGRKKKTKEDQNFAETTRQMVRW
jgi:hypothetical protein